MKSWKVNATWALMILSVVAFGQSRPLTQNRYGRVTSEYDKFDDQTVIYLHLALQTGKDLPEIWSVESFDGAIARHNSTTVDIAFTLDTSIDDANPNLVILMDDERKSYKCDSRNPKHPENGHCSVPIADVKRWIKASTVEGRFYIREFSLNSDQKALLSAFLTAIRV